MQVIVETELDVERVRRLLEPIRARGIRSLAVLLLHAYMYGTLGGPPPITLHNFVAVKNGNKRP